MSGHAQPGEDDEVVAIVRAAPFRRVFGTGMLGVLGGIFLWVALSSPPSEPGWLVFLLVAAGLSLWGAWRMWLATEPALILTRQALREDTGAELARIDAIASVERGILAFKPSNGFLLNLKEPAPSRHWSPGLWWRFGRRVGVGGVTGAGETRAMADLISIMVAERKT